MTTTGTTPQRSAPSPSNLILVTGATGYVLYPIHGPVFDSMIDRLSSQASA